MNDALVIPGCLKSITERLQKYCCQMLAVMIATRCLSFARLENKKSTYRIVSCSVRNWNNGNSANVADKSESSTIRIDFYSNTFFIATVKPVVSNTFNPCYRALFIYYLSRSCLYGPYKVFSARVNWLPPTLERTISSLCEGEIRNRHQCISY